MTQVCANCGTEVDEDAIFCPTCGQPIQAAAEPQLPPAPDWPTPAPRAVEPMAAESPPAEARDEWRAAEQPRPEDLPSREPPDLAATQGHASSGWAEPGGAEPEPPATPAGLPAADPAPFLAGTPPPAPRPEDVPPWRRGVAIRPTPVPSPPDHEPPGHEPRADSTAGAPSRSRRALSPDAGLRPQPTIVVPETIAGWLGSIGAAVGVLALFLPWRTGFGYTASWGLASGVNLLFAIVLLALLVALLMPHIVPEIPRRNLWIAGIGLVGLGIGLDRFGLPLTGMGANVFLIAMLLVAGGGLVAELGYDRPTRGTRR
jgi:zinc-ribbon domain